MQYVTEIWALSMIVTLIGCIPYGIWVTRSALKKRWKKVAIQIGAPVAFFALLVGATPIANSYASDRYFRDLYDTDVELADPKFEYDSDRAFNGDGYSISIHDLPTKIRDRFEDPDSRLLNEFPKRPHYRSDWSVVTWKATPFDSGIDKYLNFALVGSSAHSKEIRDALSRKGAFYAFFHYDHGGSPGNIDFFIVDLVSGLLYSINVNT